MKHIVQPIARLALAILLSLWVIAGARAADPAKRTGAGDDPAAIAKVLKWKDGKKSPVPAGVCPQLPQPSQERHPLAQKTQHRRHDL